MNFIKIIQIIIFFLLLTSCNNNEEISEKAISAFATDFSPKIDPRLAQKQITLPKQIKNNNFNGIFIKDSKKIENFALKNNIKKTQRLSYGYVTSNPYDIVSSPVIANNIIYILDARGNLIAINLENNNLIYQKRIIDWSDITNLSQGKLFFDQDIIYITTGFNKIFAINAQNADIIWSKELSSIAISRAIAHEDNIYLITNDNKTYALDKITGNIKWVHNAIVKKNCHLWICRSGNL